MTTPTRPHLEVLHVPDCPNLAPMLERLAEVTDVPVVTREITTDTQATRYGMSGSPTLLVDGVDPFAAPGGNDCGVACRLYRDEHDRFAPVPSAAQLRQALAGATASPRRDPAQPVDLLGTWRARALPRNPVERRVHRAILRGFATTGRAPEPAELDPLTSGTGHTTVEVLAALRDLDAIQLTPAGRVAVAYPFSATPTRHRVRLPDGIEMYAMCAVDALGMSAMLGQDVRIDSADAATGEPVAVTMTAGRTGWEPETAVVFIGASAGDGPSADCCCDYLNFFTDHASATTWAAAHPQIPGQILTQSAAEDLGRQLFQPLLTSS